MADINSNAVADTASAAWQFKNQLAWVVFLISTGGILFVSYFAMGTTDASRREIFTALVPLFSTWVGTILAFYFSKENFEAASKQVEKAFDKLTPEQEMQQTSVSQVMKRRNAIKGINLANAADEANILVADIRQKMEEGFSRVAIFAPGDIIKYLVHEATVNKFLADNAAAGRPIDLAVARLPELLAFKIGNDDVKSIVSKFAFVRSDASLQDARNEMLLVKGAQDVFVTKTGKKDEPVEGWLTNTDITKDL